jgi:hypothetical protein
MKSDQHDASATGNADDEIAFVKTEINFFMEKLFHSSFVYVGAIFATLATTNFNGSEIIAGMLGVSSYLVLIGSVLIANVVFLVLACSCTFAILKRGMFILQRPSRIGHSSLTQWERFVRRSTTDWDTLSWNVDNYYVGVLITTVLAMSVLAGVIGFRRTVGVERWIVGGLSFLHVLPVCMLILVARVDRACRRELRAGDCVAGEQSNSS